MLNVSRFLVRCLVGPNICTVNQVRFQSSRRMLEEPGLVCFKGSLKDVYQSAIKSKSEAKKTFGPMKKPHFKWFNNPCRPDPESTYDEDFAHFLQHQKRTTFQKTWNECPPRRLVQKVICGEPLPEPKCEVIGRKTHTAPTEECKKQDSKCPRITLPGCNPPDERKFCKKIPFPSICEKIKCPFPAYSECERPKPPPLRPVESSCLRMRGMCDIYRMFRAKGNLEMKKR